MWYYSVAGFALTPPFISADLSEPQQIRSPFLRTLIRFTDTHNICIYDSDNSNALNLMVFCFAPGFFDTYNLNTLPQDIRHLCLSVFPSVCLSVCLSACLSVFPSVCLSVCLSAQRFGFVYLQHSNVSNLNVVCALYYKVYSVYIPSNGVMT